MHLEAKKRQEAPAGLGAETEAGCPADAWVLEFWPRGVCERINVHDSKPPSLWYLFTSMVIRGCGHTVLTARHLDTQDVSGA